MQATLRVKFKGAGVLARSIRTGFASANVTNRGFYPHVVKHTRRPAGGFRTAPPIPGKVRTDADSRQCGGVSEECDASRRSAAHLERLLTAERLTPAPVRCRREPRRRPGHRLGTKGLTRLAVAHSAAGKTDLQPTRTQWWRSLAINLSFVRPEYPDIPSSLARCLSCGTVQSA